MTMEQKVARSLEIIRSSLEHEDARPALLCSFGKDSTVLAYIIKHNIPTPALHTHKFPMPVIYWRLQWWQHKNEFSDSLRREWDLEVWDWLPEASGIKINAGQIELVTLFSLGPSIGAIAVPAGALPPEEFPDKPYLCGLRDWILRPFAKGTFLPWNTFFIGHKDTDEDFDGPVPLRSEREELAGQASLVFPLKHWTDDDIWDYINAHNIPYDRKRYGAGRGAKQDKWQSTDVFHACTRCIDPREKEQFVFCPKLQCLVPMQKNVLEINFLPDYIKEARAQQRVELGV